MKKSITVFGAILLSVFTLSSCGSSLESDAKKVAEFQCKSQKMTEKILNGGMSASTENIKLAAEGAKLLEEIEGKYSSAEDKQKFEEAVLEEMGNCE